MKQHQRFITLVARAFVESFSTDDARRDACVELASLGEVWKGHVWVRATVLLLPSRAEQHAFFQQILRGRVSLEVLNVVSLLVERRCLRLLPSLLFHVERLCAERGWGQEVKVTTAVPLSEEEQHALQSIAERAVSGAVRLTLRVDATVLGGFWLEAQDWQYDATIRAYLKQLSRDLNERMPISVCQTL